MGNDLVDKPCLIDTGLTVWTMRDGLEELYGRLDNQNNHTLAIPLDHPSQLLLNYTGRTESGRYRMTSMAFRKICSRLAPGLASTLLDLSGQRRPTSSEQSCSIEESVDFFNAFLKRRFDPSLSNCMMLANTDTETIDAILGPGYQRLPNRQFAQDVLDKFENRSRYARYHSAVLIGRCLTLRLASAPTQGNDHHVPGWSFTNSESGDLSLRGTSALIWHPSGSAALAPYLPKMTARHTGPAFWSQVDDILDLMSVQNFDRMVTNPDEVLAQYPLGITDRDDERQADRYRNFLQSLQKAGLTTPSARRTLSCALRRGGRPVDPTSTYEPFDNRSGWSERTFADLYRALLTVAETLSQRSRERSELLAWKLLNGQWKPSQEQQHGREDQADRGQDQD